MQMIAILLAKYLVYFAGYFKLPHPLEFACQDSLDLHMQTRVGGINKISTEQIEKRTLYPNVEN